ncbi:MAG: pyridoxamine 5'-phosphate oxidase [Chitinophagaceae bacterium]|nr:MAG: pyridoxamine 5'-phosphate oxidase [Chitinophagaceae bacterium]
MVDRSIADIRKDYASRELLEAGSAADPMQQFGLWWNEALQSEIDEVNAMTLATASGDGMPAARIVLLKGFDESGFVFFTNYQSFKGMQLAENPRACLVFFWKELERQVRITGLVEKVPAAESNAYFESRPEGSRIGAWTSPQSLVIPGREWLEEAYAEQAGLMAGHHIERPEFWGGYRVRPIIVEFWQGRPSRLHDRLQYTLEDDGKWKRERLAP